MRRAGWLAGLLLASLAMLPALAQEPAGKPSPSLSIGGRIEHPRTVTLAELRAMPAATVELDSTTSKGVEHVKYTGPLLWTLMQAAQPVDDPSGGNTALQPHPAGARPGRLRRGAVHWRDRPAHGG